MNKKTESRIRLSWAEGALFALERCRPEHADAICAAWLEESKTSGPQSDVFGTVFADAKFWAEAAPPHELVAYTIAGLHRLPAAHTGIVARKKVFTALWERFQIKDRMSFLKRVDPEGNFHGGTT